MTTHSTENTTADSGPPTTFEQLRQLLPARGRYYYNIILPQDPRTINREGAYVVRPLPDGRIRVTVWEREMLFDESYPDEATAVAAVNARLPPFVYGPPPTPEQRQRSKERQEANRQRMLAKMRQTQHSLDHGHPSSDSD